MMIAAPGSWSSPLTAGQLARAGVRLAEPRYDGDDLYWIESRPAEGGRVALMRERHGEAADVAPGLSVRTRVHEYGGGAWHVRDGVAVASSDPGGQLLRLDDEGPVPLTPEGRGWRFADLRVIPTASLVIAVREDHSTPGEVVNTLVCLRLDGPNDQGGTVLASGADFYACPELSPDGILAWMEWRQPSMPWNSCSIMSGRLDFEQQTVTEPHLIAGGPDESAVHPLWRGQQLLFCSDRSGFTELYGTAADGAVVRLTELDADLVEPFWVFGRRPYAVTGEGDLVIRPRVEGCSRPVLLRDGEYLALAPEVVECDSLDAAPDGRIVLLAEFADVPAEIVELTAGGRRRVRSSAPRTLEPSWVSHPEPVSWPGESGPVHGWFYPPANPDHRPGDPGGRSASPPLIVMSHGGPTAFSSCGFDEGVQFWTTRGFAVLDVNYSGSSGYGRAYLDRLQGQWGVLDVADCVAGAHHLAADGRVDGGRLVIRGGSAGGYTTLRALTTSTAFAAGCSRYGIGDLSALASDTHKFEARYLEGLIGPWPEAAHLYAERSPINHVDRLNCPMLILQGADDAVVPPNQAETMARAVSAKGLEAELIIFEGEGHGFRRAETIERALEAELAFYQRVLGLTT